MKKITLLVFLLAMLTFGVKSQTKGFDNRYSDFNNRNATSIRTEESGKSKQMKSGEIRDIAKENFVKMVPILDTLTNGSSCFSKEDEELTASSKIENSFNWGVGIMVEDGSQLLFTQRNEISFYNVGTPFYKSTTIDFLNDDKNVTKSVTLKVPDTTMQISVLRQFSKTMFNSDSKFEFMVQAHGFEGGTGLGPTSCRDTLYVINEDGLILKKFGWASGANLVFDSSVTPTLRKLMVFAPNYAGVQTDTKADIYAARTLALEHTFSIPHNLLNYSDGPIFSYIKLDGAAYYYVGHYEQSFMMPDSDPRNPTARKNNKYMVKLYDATTYELAKEIKLNIMGEADDKWCMVTHGFFSGDANMTYDLSTKVFNSDDKFEILYGIWHYNPADDSGDIEYYLVDEDNTLIKTVPFLLNPEFSPIRMGSIVGEEDQFGLLGGKGGGVERIRFMNMPSFDTACDFTSVHDGELLSLSFERIVASGGYNYVFGLGWGEMIGDDMYGRIGYYSKDGELLKVDKINLGSKKIQSFSPIIQTAMISPYWFDTDEGNEYAYFIGIFIDPEIPTGFFRVSENDGEMSYSWSKNSYGWLNNAGVLFNSLSVASELYVGFKPPIVKPGDNVNCLATLFYKLPFKSFTNGGAGTAEDPYVITNPGELNAMRDHLDAHFVLGNDIDLFGYSTTDGKGWLGIGTTQRSFMGTLDGNNYAIKNMYINRTLDAGLFANTTGAVIKNLSMIDVEIVNGDCVGAIVASAGSSLMENCHVTGSLVGKQNVGGIVGKTTQKSMIKMCSFEGEIDGKSSGGITSSLINSKVILSYSKGIVKGGVGVGGIVGATGNNSSVDNCYSTAEIKGTGSAGGVIGQHKSCVERVYSTGNVSALGNQYSARAASIAGAASSNMTGDTYLKNSVGYSSLITAPKASGRVTGENGGCNLSNNYALSTMKVGAAGSEAAVTSADATSLNGADKVLADMNQSFYEGIEWKFGADSLNPWKMSENYPHLWYEFIVRSVALNETEQLINRGSTFQLMANVIPATAENKKVFWESSDNAIITVSKTGLVTAIGEGVGTVTVTTDDGDCIATCVFTVKVGVISITLDKTTADIAKSKSVKLVATINPTDATNKSVIWTSSDITIATVSATGLITAVKVGEATITATTEDGGLTATCKIKVVIPAIKIILDETTLNIQIAETAQLTATVRPADANNKDVTWSSSDESIATVSTTGLVTGMTNGKAVITVTTIDGGFKATCNVQVGTDSVKDIDDELINIFYANGQIVLNSGVEIKEVMVYDINGRNVYNGQESLISTALWNDGVYVVKAIDVNNVIKISKVVIK